MKINIIIIAYLILGGTLYAQEPLSKVANIKTPSSSESISYDELSAHMKKNFKRKFTVNQNARHIYSINGILLSFWDTVLDNEYAKQNIPTLDESKKQFVNLYEGELKTNAVIDEVNIKTINGIRMLISKVHDGDEYFYNFYSEFRNYKNISGIVQFKIKDKQRAEKIFDDLIKSISFKK